MSLTGVDMQPIWWILAVALIVAIGLLKPLLTGRDSFSGTTLKPGVATLADVEQTMGKPAEIWRNEAGQVIQLAYPRGPSGYVSFMVHLSDTGTIDRIEQVLDEPHFALVLPGMSMPEVLRILGPARSTNTFPAKNRLYWNYGYCSEHGRRMEYAIEFDIATQRVTGHVEVPDPLVNGSESGFCSPWRGR